MNYDEPKFDKKMFSVVQECPKCGQLCLSYRQNKIICSNCGYEQSVPAIK
ncbi:hypothetical protein HYX07_05405 [Candidatus Woesearchaeota archaeon]|nr:hypothetical protein [Candidatus Woesearchaeota archaeon]